MQSAQNHSSKEHKDKNNSYSSKKNSKERKGVCNFILQNKQRILPQYFNSNTSVEMTKNNMKLVDDGADPEAMSFVQLDHLQPRKEKSMMHESNKRK